MDSNTHNRGGVMLSDADIDYLACNEGMLSPYTSQKISQYNVRRKKAVKVISYGLSSVGYDARLAYDFVEFKPALPKTADNSGINIIDPKNVSDDVVDKFSSSEPFLIKPHGFLLGHTFEYFKMPKDVMAIAVGKSTLARVGLIVNVTPIEPGWEGQVVIEISNTTDCYIKIYPGEGISQFLFFKFKVPPENDYLDLGGKYQKQTGVTLSKA